ncbi:FecR family protein [Arenibacter sp. 6A1]|uniref:FecR family protein n=1 Tax=Arenibacter sp. 6A1 TaxID=2720391 RepID=UPI0014452B49|nr:FecR family protein [Arenibacter sp. 6A1]NKI27436.1 FecR family protein [Arenibacter sp. 6A1]
MINREIENIITKYLFQSANSEELDRLNIWIQYPGNELIFKDYVKTHFAITLSMNDPEIEQIRKKLRKEIQKDKDILNKFKLKSIFKYAAIAVFFLGVGYYFQHALVETIPVNKITPNVDAITLELGDGGIEVISEDGNSKVLNSEGDIIGLQQGEKLVYEENTTEREISYNTLSVPRGKQFSIKLSDGTQVYLNAESSIKYPTTFLPKEQRKVFLTGEAFFEVAHDSNRPFIINAQQLEVMVYGTTFNVANYPEDESTEVVLLKGSVSLLDKSKHADSKDEIFLEPGFKGSFKKEDGSIIKEKVNTSIYTSWKNGNLVFRELSFEKIIQKLERHYNVNIINNNKKLANESFNATIETQHETIEQVLNYFNKVYQIEYIIVENKIIIN